MIHRRLSQDRETAPTVESGGGFAWRYAYARAADTAAADDPGQDYLAFRCDDRRFVFALCDGVSQSFFGDLAARWLGDGLVDWLWNGQVSSWHPRDLQSRLATCLLDLAAGAAERVRLQPLPANLPPMLREVLEQKRGMGSESTFVAGRIDRPGASQAGGRLCLMWMGDTRLRLWGPEGERTRELGDSFQVAQRWSTRWGPIGGEPHLFVAPLESGEGTRRLTVMAYSDGLANLDGHQSSPSALELSQAVEGAVRSPASDDLSFLEVRLGRIPPDWRSRSS